MDDPQVGGDSHVQASGGSVRMRGGLEAGSGTPDQGESPERAAGGNDAGIPGGSIRCFSPESAQGSPEREDDLHFKLKVLEEIASETTSDAKIALILLLEGEGNRSRAIAEAEVRTEESIRLRTLAVQQTQFESDARIQQEKVKADSAADLRKDRALRHVSWRFTVTTLAPRGPGRDGWRTGWPIRKRWPRTSVEQGVITNPFIMGKGARSA